jgi:hypothetical protein
MTLQPCPWCRADGDRVFDLWDRFDAGTVAHVNCTRCGADGPSVYSEVSADDAIAQARQRWNGRRPAVITTHNDRIQPRR